MDELTPISKDTAVRAAAYGALLAGWGAAAPGTALAPLLGTVFALACLLSLLLERRWPRLFLPSVVKIGLIVMGSMVFVGSISSGAAASPDHFAAVISRFLLWNALVFALSRAKTDYDLWTMGIIDLSFFMISAAFLKPVSYLPLFFVSMALFLYAFHRAALLRCGAAGERATGWVSAGLQIALVLEVAAVVFLGFPRAVFSADPEARRRNGGAEDPEPRGPEGESRRSPTSRSGLSSSLDRLALKGLDRMLTDKTPVMEVGVEPASAAGTWRPDRPLLLRATILDGYRGGEWFTTPVHREAFDGDDSNPDGWVTLREDRGKWGMIRQYLRLLTDLRAMIPTAPEPMRINLPAVMVDRRGLLHPTEGQGNAGDTYEVVSAYVPDDLLATLPPATPVMVVSPTYRVVPEGLDGLRALAQQITAGAGGPAGRAAAIRKWLSDPARFRYRMAGLDPPAGREPILHFLETSRAGICMHFASAAVLLCRAAGVPARFVTGFMIEKGVQDDATGRTLYFVRKMDAHAWAEVAIDGAGWVPLDATPADPATTAAEASRPDVPTQDDPSKREKGPAPNAPGGRWDRLILEFDPGSQSGFLRSLSGWIGSAVSAAWRFLTRPVVLIPLLLLGAAGVAFYALLPARKREALRRALAGRGAVSSVGFYQDFLFEAGRAGLRKGPSLTGREFAAAARAVLPPDAVDFITDRFYDVRYAGRPLRPEEERRVDEMLTRIELAVKERREPPVAGPQSPSRP